MYIQIQERYLAKFRTAKVQSAYAQVDAKSRQKLAKNVISDEFNIDHQWFFLDLVQFLFFNGIVIFWPTFHAGMVAMTTYPIFIETTENDRKSVREYATRWLEIHRDSRILTEISQNRVRSSSSRLRGGPKARQSAKNTAEERRTSSIQLKTTENIPKTDKTWKEIAIFPENFRFLKSI